MFLELINNSYIWLKSYDWGTASDVLGAIANIIMAFAAIWGARTASSWLDNKTNDAAERVFNEIHDLYAKYNKVYNKTRDSYEAVQVMYGVSKHLNPEGFSVYKELQLARGCYIYCSSEMDLFTNKLRHSMAIKTKYKGGGGPLEFAKLLGCHNLYREKLLMVNKFITNTIKEQNESKSISELQRLEDLWGELDEIYERALQVSHDIKSISFDDIFKVK